MYYYINNIKWQIKYIDANNFIFQRKDGSRTVGVCVCDLHTIYIADSLSTDFKRKVLIHEVCHSAMYSYGVYLDDELEEIVCDIVASFGEEIIDIVDRIFYGFAQKNFG